jgi:hypothetical protein
MMKRRWRVTLRAKADRAAGPPRQPNVAGSRMTLAGYKPLSGELLASDESQSPHGGTG